MTHPIRRRVAAAALGLGIGLAGFGSVAMAHRPGNGGGHPGHGHHHHHHDGSLINVALDDIDLDVLEVAISKVLAVADVDVEDVTVVAKDVVDVLAKVKVKDVTGVDLDAAINTVLNGVVSGDILSNNSAVVRAVANDVINVSNVAVAAAADVADSDVLSDNNVNVLGCQTNVEGNGNFNGPGDDGNNCGLLDDVDADVLDGDLLDGDLLDDDLLDGPLSILLTGDADADASVTARILALF